MSGPRPSTPLPPILPILERRKEIEEAISRHQVVVLCGQTGSGKTTQLPQICLDMGLARHGLIGHTQPRRLAARAVAARIAEERSVRLGGLVGVKVRFHDQTSRDTRIKVMTDGVLLAELSSDPRLLAYSTIIIDEAHERSLNVDFLLGYLRRLVPARPDLKLIITSATIDPKRFSDAFGGPQKAALIEVAGRTYPFETRYRPTRGDEDGEEVNIQAVADAVDELARPSMAAGDVLVFLPGEREIRLVDTALRRGGIDAEVLPLFSRLSNQEQDRIFHPGGRRRVILATNVAETSLTVPGIGFVVDTGLARTSRYEPHRKVQTLPIEPVSQASADQRAGRCGRISAGVCIRLYSEDSYRARPAFTEPEIRRTNLAGVILRMRSLDLGAVEEFPFLDPPDAAGVRDGYETLFELGAIDEPKSSGRITPIGQAMSRVPVDPRIARMLLAAETQGSLSEILVLAAALEIQDPRERPMNRQEDADRAQSIFRHESSDFLTLLRLWDQYNHAADTLSHGQHFNWCRDHFLAPSRMREWSEMTSQLRRTAEDLGLHLNPNPASDDAIHRALLTGLISNVACREAEGGSFDYRAVRADKVQIFPGSTLFKKGPRWIMAAELVQTSRLFARTVAKIDPAWIEELAGHMFRHQLTDEHLDAATGEPSAWERVTMSGIVVVPRRQTAIARVDPKAARSVFIREGLARAKWTTDAPFMRHNRDVLERARQAEAKLRRRNVLASDEELFAWFDARIPPDICEPAGFLTWLGAAEKSDPAAARLPLEAVLRPDARVALDPDAYPDALELDSPAGVVSCPIDYALSPGKDDDGATVTAALTSLPLLPPDRAPWLVPGMLPELVQALIKTLPKPQRSSLEAKGALGEISAAVAGVLNFGSGPLSAALSEAADVLYSVHIEPGAWSFKSLPMHLRLRVRVVDDSGKELAVDRDVPALLTRLEGRLRRAGAAQARARFERSGLTTWDFGDLPEIVRTERDGVQVEAYPAILDHRDSVSLTLLDSPREATIRTLLGLRRLFELACREELQHHVASLPQWSEMTRHYGQLGSAEQLRRDVGALIAERTFINAQAPIRTKAEFDARLAECWGRLAASAREVGDAVARTLEPRFRIAHRFSGGTPRLWAQSVADIREHAAYLMPRDFLSLLSWDRIRRYPRYAESMRERLLSLREDGSKVETAALQKLAPFWKRYTGWVVAAMAQQRALAEAGETAPGEPAPASQRGKAPLPQARRAAPVVNLDAGEWAMQPGRLPPGIEQYRWALEDFRVDLFAAEPATKPLITPEQLEALWKSSQADAR